MKVGYLLWGLLFCFSCKTTHTSLHHVQPLEGNWFFKEKDTSVKYPAKVPGSIYTDLIFNHLIQDPYFADNESKVQTIENKNWVYENSFYISFQEYRNAHIVLHFLGLDTYATILINGVEVLKTDNMFRSWQVEAKPYVKTGLNTLQIHFESPIQHNTRAVKNYPHVLPSGNEVDSIPVKVSNFTRKAAYQFGWDWAPRLVGGGIWRPIHIETWNNAQIKNVYIYTQSLENGQAQMGSTLTIECDVAGEYELKRNHQSTTIELVKGNNILQYDWVEENPKLWWCNGWGEPYLYEQHIQLSKNGKKIDEKTSTYGIRIIELINEPDAVGTSFYFKLNGKPIFAKGANYVPQDMFPARVSKEQYATLLNSVKEAHMNMLRVWGGGIYEDDYFYQLCDQLGIMVWQDFMFSGSLYPNLPEWNETTKQEIEENVIRLRNHPSIALWCGNNEIEVAWKNWGWQKKYGYSAQDSTEIWNHYTTMFHSTLPNILKTHTYRANYTPTTPLSNWGTAENFNHSSMHYWGVWHGKEPFEAFPQNVGRFMVEYGFQSFPEMSTLRKVIPDSALNLNSKIMHHRQKSYIGNGLIQHHIEQYFPSPKNFEELVNLSQKTQALALEMAINSHLKKQPHCMGSLLWQLNDCWPGPSWSIIDYYGNKKPGYYSVQNIFGKDSVSLSTSN